MRVLNQLFQEDPPPSQIDNIIHEIFSSECFKEACRFKGNVHDTEWRKIFFDFIVTPTPPSVESTRLCPDKVLGELLKKMISPNTEKD